MVTYEYVVYHFMNGDDWEIDAVYLGSFGTIEQAEKYRSDYLSQFKDASPQNVQVIQLVL